MCIREVGHWIVCETKRVCYVGAERPFLGVRSVLKGTLLYKHKVKTWRRREYHQEARIRREGATKWIALSVGDTLIVSESHLEKKSI